MEKKMRDASSTVPVTEKEKSKTLGKPGGVAAKKAEVPQMRLSELQKKSDAHVIELACDLDCSRELHDWSFVVRNEVLRRLSRFRDALERIELMPWPDSESPYARIARTALEAPSDPKGAKSSSATSVSSLNPHHPDPWPPTP